MTDTEVCTLNDKTYDHVSNYGERQEYIYLSKHIYNPCFCLLPCLLSSLSSSSQLRCIPTSHNKRPWLNSYITSYETSTRTHRFLKMLQQVCSPSTAAPSASNIHHLTTNSSPALDLRHIWDKMIKKPPRVTHRSNNFPFFFSFLHPSQGVTACLRYKHKYDSLHSLVWWDMTPPPLQPLRMRIHGHEYKFNGHIKKWVSTTASNKNIHTVQPRHAWINIIEGRGAKAEKEEMTDRRDAERRWRNGGVEDFELTTELNDRRAKKEKKHHATVVYSCSGRPWASHVEGFSYFLTLLPLFQRLLLNPISTFFIKLSFTVGKMHQK